MNKVDTRTPLLQENLKSPFRRIHILLRVTAICTVLGCIAVSIYSLVERKQCTYLWLLSYSFLSLFSYVLYHNLYEEENKLGSHFVFIYFVFGCMILFDSISIIYYIVLLCRQKRYLLFIQICLNVYQLVLSAFSILVLRQIAPLVLNIYDESYSILSLIRTSFMSEKTHRIYKLLTFFIISILFFLQFWVTCYTGCSHASKEFSFYTGVLFLVIFVLYLPLYGCQVRNQWIRKIVAIFTPLLLTIYGLFSNNHLGSYVCAANQDLSGYIKAESVFLTIWGLTKLIIAIYTKTEFFLYSKEFDEAYQEAEAHINSVLNSIVEEPGNQYVYYYFLKQL